MIRYRRLYESENSDIQLYDTVKCAGHEWYVIDIEDDIVTLLDKYADYIIGKRRFDGKSNDYKTSKIRELLKNRVPRLMESETTPTPLMMAPTIMTRYRMAGIIPYSCRQGETKEIKRNQA